MLIIDLLDLMGYAISNVKMSEYNPNGTCGEKTCRDTKAQQKGVKLRESVKRYIEYRQIEISQRKHVKHARINQTKRKFRKPTTKTRNRCEKHRKRTAVVYISHIRKDEFHNHVQPVLMACKIPLGIFSAQFKSQKSETLDSQVSIVLDF